MERPSVIAVVGACGPERARCAKHLAASTRRALIPSTHPAVTSGRLEEAATFAAWTTLAAGVVVEVPLRVSTPEVIGAFAGTHALCILDAVVCAVDASHLVADLSGDDCLSLQECPAEAQPVAVSRPHLIAAQLEYSSVIVLVNWEALKPAELSLVASVICHLSPHARLCLNECPPENLCTGAYTSRQERPGWISILNETHSPGTTHPKVGALRYEHVRPFHPERLAHVLHEQFDSESCGTIVRSSGFARLAAHNSTIAHWDQAGQVITFHPLSHGESEEACGELLAIGQELAFIGINLDSARLTAALDDAVLSDSEFCAGPALWSTLHNPFTDWPHQHHPGS